MGLHVRGLFSGILIGLLSIPGDCLAQPAQQPSSPAPGAPAFGVLIAAAVTPANPSAQQQAPQQAPPPKGGMGGIAGGVGAAPVYDAKNGPSPPAASSIPAR